jgi:predicted O-methyltransferase YrrM
MTTLHAQPFSDVLHALEARADASDGQLRQWFGALPPPEQRALLETAQTDARRFYGELTREHFLSVAPGTRRLLYLLARASRARTVVEFGTSFGVSTLFLAAAVRDNGGGRVITTEFEPGKAAQARATFEAAGVADLVELREGDALQTLAQGLPERVDLVLLDGAKPLYGPLLELLTPRLRPGALVVADNAGDSPAYLAQVRADGSRYLSLPVSPEVELTQWLGV